jgi:hypothetical protein
MSKAKGKAITINPNSMEGRRSNGKSRARVQMTGRVSGAGGFRCRTLPFVKSLSRKNPIAARVLKYSYARGVAAAGFANFGDLF